MNPTSQNSLARIFNLIKHSYSGVKAKNIVNALYQDCRYITNSRYEAATRQAFSIMKEIGLDDVELLKFPCDGKRFYGNWKTPRAWDVSGAFLEVEVNGKWSRVADYKKIPTSIFVYSSPTNGDVKTEIVSIDNPSLKGKLVFCDPTDDNIAKINLSNALGVVTDFAPNWEGVRSEKDFRNGHRWDNSTLFESIRPVVGFSLSRNQGDLLRKALNKNGMIKCCYKITGSLGKGNIYCATGCIRGVKKPHEEAVVVAHLYEAGANDNCSGVASAIEALNVIKSLVKKKKLKAPDRTIRVIFTFEIVGFLAYFEYVRKYKRIYVAGVNPDMVGEDQGKCRSVLNIYQCPHPMAGFTDPLLLYFIKRAAGKRLKIALKKFIINDNMITDPMIGVPCPALIHLRDQFYHSNEDSLGKVSSDTLQRIGSAMAAYLYAAADMNPAIANETARLCLNFSKERLLEEEQKDIHQEKLAYLTCIEMMRFESIETLTGVRLNKQREGLLSVVGDMKTEKNDSRQEQLKLRKQAESMVPKRLVAGPVTLEHIPTEKRRNLKIQPHWSNKWNQPLFWVDGKRSLYAVYRLSSLETGPYDLKEFIWYFKFLKKESLIDIKKAS